ncbi:hypothetical protein BJX76DRAFT_81352 [Aspergillus varians]
MHPMTHKCDGEGFSLLCAFHRLATFYWHGDINLDTHETHMERVWKKLCGTTWSNVNVYHRQDARRFIKAFFGQLEEELKNDRERYAELEQFFRVGFRIRRACKSCEKESLFREQKLSLSASFREAIPFDQPPLYEVPEAIDHHLHLGTPVEWVCENCNRSNQIKSAIKPSTSTTHIDHLPEVLFVPVDHRDQRQRVAGKLKIEDTMTIPAGWQDDSIPGKQDVRYELYSILFHYNITLNADKDINGISILKDDWDVCAVKEPTNKWALVKSGSVEIGLALDQLLGIVHKVERKHRAYVLAYRRLPFNGEASKPNNDLSVLVKQTLYIRDGVEWTFHKRVPFPSGIDHLVELKGKARTHRAKFHVVLTSAMTGEVLEGEANISLAPRKRKYDEEPATPPKKRGRPPKPEKAAKSNDVTKASTTPRPGKAAVSTAPSSKRTRVANSKKATKSSLANTSKSPNTKDSNPGEQAESSRAVTVGTSTSRNRDGSNPRTIDDSTPKEMEYPKAEGDDEPDKARISPTTPPVLQASLGKPESPSNLEDPSPGECNKEGSARNSPTPPPVLNQEGTDSPSSNQTPESNRAGVSKSPSNEGSNAEGNGEANRAEISEPSSPNNTAEGPNTDGDDGEGRATNAGN